MFFNVIKNYLTVVVIIAIRKCAFKFMTTITFKNIIGIVWTAWSSIRRGILRIVSVSWTIIKKIIFRSSGSPFNFLKFFERKFKYCKKSNYPTNLCGDIQIKRQLQNPVFNTKGNNTTENKAKNKVNNVLRYFFKSRRLFFANLIFNIARVAHRSILVIQYFIISKILPINQENMA